MQNSIKALYLFVVMTNLSCGQKADNDINTPGETTFTAELIIDGLQNPWGMVFLPDGSMLISEKSGELILFKDGQKSTITNGPAVYNRGQGGLLDMELHPDYENNGWIYLSFASEEGEDKGGNTAIMRAKFDGN
ncbi:MAG: PQQ-dependent sugar dehydrogenase, partial [Eudoraea sp.]